MKLNKSRVEIILGKDSRKQDLTIGIGFIGKAILNRKIHLILHDVPIEFKKKLEDTKS